MGCVAERIARRRIQGGWDAVSPYPGLEVEAHRLELLAEELTNISKKIRAASEARKKAVAQKNLAHLKEAHKILQAFPLQLQRLGLPHVSDSLWRDVREIVSADDREVGKKEPEEDKEFIGYTPDTVKAIKYIRSLSDQVLKDAVRNKRELEKIRQHLGHSTNPSWVLARIAQTLYERKLISEDELDRLMR